MGYKIQPLRGYLFEKKPSPFVSFVSSLYESRLEAKITGNDAMAYGYKRLMNSL
uniref:NADH-plastoquinone oxidoreductase subunit K n=1 Tax=Corydalis trisecta TaxID=2682942 RepID=UPI001FAF1EF0|nr:NADH-plastoquinone oxidoreductase subunit K [Corydalis trisecta]ULX45341.1 NADH-plastoquinone oxidoreductase subunit K [Corydalis trisecta]